MKQVIIIPAYQPQDNLLDVVRSLIAGGAYKILVVNDGSRRSCNSIFDELKKLKGVEVLYHAVNLGKGAALKTAFNYALVNFEGLLGVITADADGQHLSSDILRLSDSFSTDTNSLWLGSREFKGSVPLRSRFGNALTKKIFSLLIGKSLIDTQTGLRGIPIPLLKEMLKVHVSGYEFELEMLIAASNAGILIKEMPIKTVYEGGNTSSHFHPILDSIKIYFVFIRFSAISIITAIIDILVFFGFFYMTSNIIYSVICSRLVAGLFNFICSKYYVFKSKKYYFPELVKYIFTVAALATISYILIDTLTKDYGLTIVSSKLIAETGLFLASFAIQRTFIFGSSEKKSI